MINIVICDDDIGFLDIFSVQLSDMLDKLHVDYTLRTISKLSELYGELEAGTYFDLIFLDIEFYLEDKSGIDLSIYLRDNLRIDSTSLVFVSSVKSYAMRLFESQPLDFLIKPVDDEHLEKVLTRFLRINYAMSECYTLTYYGRETKLPLSSIIYFQSKNHTIHIQCTGGSSYDFSGKLSDIEKELREKKFFSPHKSYLVNYYAVRHWEANSLILLDGTSVPISKSHKSEVQNIQFECEV